MSKEEVKNKVKSIIAEQLVCDVSDLKDDINLNEVFYMDSLDQSNIIVNIEKQFGINIPDQDSMSFNTVDDCVEIVEKQIV